MILQGLTRRYPVTGAGATPTIELVTTSQYINLTNLHDESS